MITWSLHASFLPQLGHPQCEDTVCTGLSHTQGTPFVVFVGHTLAFKGWFSA